MVTDSQVANSRHVTASVPRTSGAPRARGAPRSKTAAVAAGVRHRQAAGRQDHRIASIGSPRLAIDGPTDSPMARTSVTSVSVTTDDAFARARSASSVSRTSRALCDFGNSLPTPFLRQAEGRGRVRRKRSARRSGHERRMWRSSMRRRIGDEAGFVEPRGKDVAASAAADQDLAAAVLRALEQQRLRARPTPRRSPPSCRPRRRRLRRRAACFVGLPEREVEAAAESQVRRRRTRRDARHAVIAKSRRPAEHEGVARFERHRSTGSRRFSPPNRKRAVSPIDTETTGMPAPIDARSFVLVLMQTHPSVGVVEVKDTEIGFDAHPRREPRFPRERAKVRRQRRHGVSHRSPRALVHMHTFCVPVPAKAQHPHVHLAAAAHDRHVGGDGAIDERAAAIGQQRCRSIESRCGK